MVSMRLLISPGHSLYLLQLSGLLSQWLGGPSVISQAGEQLTIGVFMDIYIPTIKRQNTKVISEMISSYNSRWDFNLTDAYDHRLLSHISHIKTYSPTEVLEQVCGALVERKVNTLMFLSGKKQMMELGASAQYIIRAANILGIPVISWIRDNSAIAQMDDSAMLLQLAPSIRHECRAMLSLLKRYQWGFFSIVTSHQVGYDDFINNVRDLVDSDKGFEIMSVISIDVEEESTIDGHLRRLAKSDTRVILLYASRREAETIVRASKKHGLFGKEYVWILTRSAMGDLDGTRGTSPRAPEDYPMGLLGVYYSTGYEEQKDVLKKAIHVWANGLNTLVNSGELAKKNISLIPDIDCKKGLSGAWAGGSVLFRNMQNVSVRYPPLSFDDGRSLSNTELSIYNLHVDKKWRKIGLWNAASGISIDDVTWPSDERTPPKGRPSKYHLRVVTLEEPPYVVYSDPDPATGTCSPQAEPCHIQPDDDMIDSGNMSANSTILQCCSGFCIDLLKMLSERIRFDFKLYEVPDKKWGAPDETTKEWNGLVRTIMDNEADISVTSLKITPERSKQIEFSVPFLETGITIIVAVRDGVISPTAFLEPYDYPSWCLILVFSVHASGAAIFIFEWLSPSGLDRGNKPIREHRFSLFRSFWLIWAMLFGAAVNVDNPRGVSSRFLANIWALFAVVFTASYTANLAAFMITKEDYDKLTGLQDTKLRDPTKQKPPFKFGTVPAGSTETNLMKNYPEMHNYMKRFNKSTVGEGVRAVKDGEINAFIYDSTVLEYRAGQDNDCKLRTVGKWYAMTGYGIGFTRGSRWRNIINKYMLQFQHDGDLERLQKFWLSGACKKNSQEGESSMPLGILNFTSAFILLAGGMILGGLLLLLEHFYFKFFRAKLRKWDRCGCCGLISLSMGKSLTFEQSVREAMDLQRHHKCKNPVCETQTWKIKHELDLALLKIDRLQKTGFSPDGTMDSGQSLETGLYSETPSVHWSDIDSGGGRQPVTNRRSAPAWKNQQNRGSGPPPPIGWNTDMLPPPMSGKPPDGPVPELVNNLSPKDMGVVPVGRPPPVVRPLPPYNPLDDPPTYPNNLPPPTKWTEEPPQSTRKRKNKQPKSKSLPTSPMKRSHTTPDAAAVPPPDYPQCYPERADTSIPRTTSFPNSPGGHLQDKKTRYHRGNVYVEVDDVSQVEKETVL